MVESVLQRPLVHIVLVLSDADRLRVDLDELGQGVHQPPSDGDGAAHGDVPVRKLLPRGVGRRVDRGAALVHHHHLGRPKVEGPQKRLGLSAAGAVPDGDSLDLIAAEQVQHLPPSRGSGLVAEKKDRVGVD